MHHLWLMCTAHQQRIRWPDGLWIEGLRLSRTRYRTSVYLPSPEPMASALLDSQGHLSPPNSIDFLSLVMSGTSWEWPAAIVKAERPITRAIPYSVLSNSLSAMGSSVAILASGSWNYKPIDRQEEYGGHFAHRST
jgi:hypothetical protein